MDILQILNDLGFKGRPNYKGDLPLAYCNFHEHHFKSPSLCINIDKKLFVCYSCGAKGHIRRILYNFGISFNGWQGVTSEKEFDKQIDGIMDEFVVQPEEMNLSDEGELKKYRFKHPYLLRRGFSAEILRKNQIGFDKETARVTIPVFFQGRYYGCIKRSACGFEPRYLYPDNLQKSAIVYSPEPMASKDDSVEFWTEGSLDALKIAQFGYHANAILGSMFSVVQMDILKKSPRRKVILLDNDKAGKQGTQHLLENYKGTDIEVFVYPENIKDPGDFTEEMFEQQLCNTKDKFDMLLGW